jgi:hypothetical protein
MKDANEQAEEVEVTDPTHSSISCTGLESFCSCIVDELVRISGETYLSPDLRRTPRASVTSTGLIDDFSRTLYKISTNLNEMRSQSEKLGGSDDSHDHRAKLYSVYCISI